MFFLVRKLPPEAEFFSGFGVRFERKTIENHVSDVKNPKIFACGANLPLLLDQICIIFTCDIDFLVFALSFQSKNNFLFH